MSSVEMQGVDPQAVRANKLELVERLADDLAHEIKNPLHSMVINLEVLKRRISRSAGAEAEDFLRYVGVLANELERVNRRVDLLLRMVRPERGGDPVSLGAMVEELLDLVELERERQGISIDYHPSPRPVRGRLPRDSARQMVLNLLLAALEATGVGGTLSITLEADDAEERLRLHLAAAPESAERNPSVSSGVEEEGMRLAVARALGGALGGRLQVGAAEAPRGGTEYILSLSTSAV